MVVVEVGLWWWWWGVVDWVVFVVAVGCPKPLLWAVVVGCGGRVGFFCWLSLGFFFFCWICGLFLKKKKKKKNQIGLNLIWA